MAEILALDIGGSSIKYGLVNEINEITDLGKKEVCKDSLEAFFSSIQSIIQQFDGRIEGVAISQAASIDSKTGYVINGGAFPFLQGKNFIEECKSFCSFPTSVENDAICAALAEMENGSLKDIKNGIAVILGSAIGGCLIFNKEVYRGTHSFAAQLSLVKTDGQDNSTSSLWMRRNGAHGLQRAVSKELGTDEKLNGFEIFERVKKGDEKVRKGLQNFCRELAIQLYNLQSVLDVDLITIGGGISAQPLLLEMLNEEMDTIFNQEIDYHLPIQKPRIVTCHYQNEANLLGAVLHYRTEKK